MSDFSWLGYCLLYWLFRDIGLLWDCMVCACCFVLCIVTLLCGLCYWFVRFVVLLAISYCWFACVVFGAYACWFSLHADCDLMC